MVAKQETHRSSVPPSAGKRIAQSIRAFQAEMEMTQEEFAEWLSRKAKRRISKRTIEGWVQGRGIPTGDAIVLMLDAGMKLLPRRRGKK